MSLCLSLVMAVNQNVMARQEGSPDQITTAVPPMSVVSSSSSTDANSSVDPRDYFLKKLNLKTYEVLNGTLSSCGDDDNCQEDVERTRGWLCAAQACHKGPDGAVGSCFKGVADKYSTKDRQQLETSLCSLFKSAEPQARQAMLKFSGISEADMVEHTAYVLALKQSPAACEKYIKDFKGPYGPGWTLNWNRILSGCRILSGQRTRVEEENDFMAWYKKVYENGTCMDIVDNEIKNACLTPGTALPLPEITSNATKSP